MGHGRHRQPVDSRRECSPTQPPNERSPGRRPHPSEAFCTLSDGGPLPFRLLRDLNEDDLFNFETCQRGKASCRHGRTTGGSASRHPLRTGGLAWDRRQPDAGGRTAARRPLCRRRRRRPHHAQPARQPQRAEPPAVRRHPPPRRPTADPWPDRAGHPLADDLCHRPRHRQRRPALAAAADLLGVADQEERHPSGPSHDRRQYRRLLLLPGASCRSSRPASASVSGPSGSTRTSDARARSATHSSSRAGVSESR